MRVSAKLRRLVDSGEVELIEALDGTVLVIEPARDILTDEVIGYKMRTASGDPVYPEHGDLVPVAPFGSPEDAKAYAGLRVSHQSPL